MALRTRLLTGVLVMTAVGLLAAGGGVVALAGVHAIADRTIEVGVGVALGDGLLHRLHDDAEVRLEGTEGARALKLTDLGGTP